MTPTKLGLASKPATMESPSVLPFFSIAALSRYAASHTNAAWTVGTEPYFSLDGLMNLAWTAFGLSVFSDVTLNTPSDASPARLINAGLNIASLPSTGMLDPSWRSCLVAMPGTGGTPHSTSASAPEFL